MHELDWVFDGDDVIRSRAVHQVNHGAQCGRLAGASRPGHQYEAFGEGTERLYLRRKPHLVNSHRTIRDRADHCRHAKTIPKHIHAKTRHVFDLVREIGVPLFVEFTLVLVRHDGPQHAGNVVFVQRGLVGYTHHIAAHAKDGRLTRPEMQIGRPTRHLQAQQAFQRSLGLRFPLEGAKGPVAGATPELPGAEVGIRVLWANLLDPLPNHQLERGRPAVLRHQIALAIPCIQQMDSIGLGNRRALVGRCDLGNQRQHLLSSERLLGNRLHPGRCLTPNGLVGFQNHL